MRACHIADRITWLENGFPLRVAREARPSWTLNSIPSANSAVEYAAFIMDVVNSVVTDSGWPQSCEGSSELEPLLPPPLATTTSPGTGGRSLRLFGRRDSGRLKCHATLENSLHPRPKASKITTCTVHTPASTVRLTERKSRIRGLPCTDKSGHSSKESNFTFRITPGDQPAVR